MLLNVPPTTTGSFAPSSVAALESFSSLRRQAYGDNAALGATGTAGQAEQAPFQGPQYARHGVTRAGCR